MTARKKRQELIRQGFKLLQEHIDTSYDQLTILNKLKFLECFISKATLSNLYNQKRVGDKTLKLVADGFGRLIEAELCMIYDEANECFRKIEKECLPRVIPEFGKEKIDERQGELPYLLHIKGRLFIAEKAKLIRAAEQVVYQVGIRLRRYTDYYTTRSDEEYRIHVEGRLAKGVDFNCYLLNPDSNITHLYFTDRASIFPKENGSIRVIKETINDLLDVQHKFNKKKLSGRFRIFTYSNIPHHAILAIDPFSAKGKMVIQHYIHAVERRECPSLQFNKLHAPKLFNNYCKALNSIINNSQEIIKKYNI